MVETLRGAIRLAHMVGLLVWGWYLALWPLRQCSPETRHAIVSGWAQSALRAMGVRCQLEGTSPAQGPVLVVSNHVSWVDILVLLAVFPCRFVAKSEVKAWPVVGTMAKAANTLFIERESKRDVIRVVHYVAQALANDECVAVFPEGTTSDGQGVLPFHANLFQAALATNSPIQATTLAYVDAQGALVSPHVAYVGDDSMLGSLWRTVRRPSVIARVQLIPPSVLTFTNRRACAQWHEQAIQNNLGQWVAEQGVASR